MAADDHAFAMKIKDTVMAAVDETRFTRVVGMMREATTVQMNTTDIPGVVRLASKDFNITEEESTGVLQRLIEGKDLTLYGLSNAVTRFSQDVDSYDRATAWRGSDTISCPCPDSSGTVSIRWPPDHLQPSQFLRRNHYV